MDIDDLSARLTIAQAAEVAALSGKTIRRYIADGRLRAYRVGNRCIRVDRASLIALMRPMGSA